MKTKHDREEDVDLKKKKTCSYCEAFKGRGPAASRPTKDPFPWSIVYVPLANEECVLVL